MKNMKKFLRYAAGYAMAIGLMYIAMILVSNLATLAVRANAPGPAPEIPPIRNLFCISPRGNWFPLSGQEWDRATRACLQDRNRHKPAIATFRNF